MTPFYKYKNIRYSSPKDAYTAFLIDEYKEPHTSGVTYHDTSEFVGTHLTGVDSKGNPYHNQLSDDLKNPIVSNGLQTYNELATQDINTLRMELEKKNSLQHFKYKGVKYDNLEEAMQVFLDDDDKYPHMRGVTFHDDNELSGYQVMGVSNDGKAWFSQMDWIKEFPEIAKKEAAFNEYINNGTSLDSLSDYADDPNFDRHYSYKGIQYELPEEAMQAFFEDKDKLPNRYGVYYHNRSNLTGIVLTGTDSSGNTWYTQDKQAHNNFAVSAGEKLYNMMNKTKDFISNFNFSDRLNQFREQNSIEKPTVTTESKPRL